MGQQTEGAQGRDEKPAGRPRGYKTVSNTLPSSTEIQRQGDNVLRYTKAPTVMEKYKQNEETTDEESPYWNIAMVNFATKTDLTHAKGEKLKEMLELEELEEAPKAPTPLPVSATKKKRKGFVKSMSRRVSKRLGRKKGKQSEEAMWKDEAVCMLWKSRVPTCVRKSLIMENENKCEDMKEMNLGLSIFDLGLSLKM